VRFQPSTWLVFGATLLLLSCGGDGGSQMSTPISVLSYSTPQTYVRDVAITPLVPTIAGGTPTSYSASPALPAGLSLSSTTGVISGTPSAASAQTVYTVTASNSSSSAQATLTITVNDLAAPQIAYASTYYAFTAGMAGTIPAPVNSGGGYVTYGIAPALPASLTLGTDGSIQGTPSAAAAAATYTVTAVNPRGSVTFPLTIAVGPPPLLDLGHATGVVLLKIAGSRLLSQDRDGHWLLQDLASGNGLASGDAPCAFTACVPVDIAGNVMVDATSQGMEIRAAADGHLITTVPVTLVLAGRVPEFVPGLWWQLAADGSYLVTADTTGLTVYDTASAGVHQLASRSGDYFRAVAYAAPGQLQVANGPAGANVIETVAVATGSSTVGPAFLGTFSSWFLDGGRFLTTLGTTVWTYSSAGVQQDFRQLPTVAGLAGRGNWFWTVDSSSPQGVLAVYQVGASQSPVLTQTVGYGLAIPSGPTIGIFAFETYQLSVVDLSGSTPSVSAAHLVPACCSYAATSASAWVTGGDGDIFDGASLGGQPRYLSLGHAWIAGGTSYVSVATASGTIFTFDPTTNAQVGTISFPAWQLSASLDGTVLAAAALQDHFPYATDRSVNVYSLPSGTLIHSFPYAYPGPPLPTAMSLSGSGTVMAQTFADASGGCGSEVIATTGGTPLWCSPTVQQLLTLSPDGTEESSVSNTSINYGDSLFAPFSITNIFHNGTVIGAVSGAAVGWLDNGRLLVNSYALGHTTPVYSAGLYDPTGKLLAAAPVPELHSIQPLTGDTVYSPERNIILSLTQGQVSWASANTGSGTGAAAGSEVLFVSGTQVLAQPAVTGAAAAATAQRQRLSRRYP
jgi:hypothetical protein